MLNLSEYKTLDQQSAHESRSEKYSHLSTAELIRILEALGFHPSKVYETNTRKADKRGYQKHMVRFRKEGAVTVGDSLPEIVAINSHDGTCGLQLWAGIFRLICKIGRAHV